MCARRPTTAPSDRTARRERTILGDDDFDENVRAPGLEPGHNRSRVGRPAARARRAWMVETAGIEPANLPPEGSALPLRYVSMVSAGGLEPPPVRDMNPLPCRWATRYGCGGSLENRTLRSLIASEARRPWNMATRMLVGTDGVEPPSSRLQRDARTVSAASPWRSGRESNALVACATHRCSGSTPYRSATTP